MNVPQLTQEPAVKYVAVSLKVCELTRPQKTGAEQRPFAIPLSRLFCPVVLLAAAQLGGEALAELLHPGTDGPVSVHYATSEQQLLDIPEAQRKTVIEPERMADDLCWVAVSRVIARALRHDLAELR